MPFVNNWATLGPGAPVIALLLGLSVVATAIVLLQLWQWRGVRLRPPVWLDEAVTDWKKGESPDARAHLAGQLDPLSMALLSGMAASPRGEPGEAFREAFERQGAASLLQLRYGLRTLEIIGQLAPLIGLFGTVLGMIDAFQALEAAQGPVDPGALSGGIWTALITTAAGLALAIPCVLAFNLLDQRVVRLAHAMDELLSRTLYPGAVDDTP